MPLHDWTRVGDWVREDFRLGWLVYLRNAMNAGRLPPGYHAHIGRRADLYLAEGRREFHSAVCVRADERVVAVVELVSADDTARPTVVADFARKLAASIRAGRHTVVVDVGPLGRSRMGAVHRDVGCALGVGAANDEPRSHEVASFRTDPPAVELFLDAYTVGQSLPATHLFLDPVSCVPLPLEETYQHAITMLDPKSRAALSAPSPEG